MSQVPIVQTAPTSRVYAAAFIRAWRALYGEYPTKAQCGVLWSQWMVETSGKACWNWNIGNVKISQSQVDAGLPWIDLLGTKELIGGKWITLKDGDPGRRFRAYDSLADAMREHMALLRGKAYHAAWPFIESGDPVGFTHALKAGADGIEGTWDDYFTAPVEDYLRILVASHQRWMAMPDFDAALADVTAEDERNTEPAILTADQLEAEPAIVHAIPESTWTPSDEA